MSDITQDALPLPQENAPSRGRTTGFLLALIPLIGLLGLVGWGLVKAQQGPVRRGLAPDFSLTSFGGESITLSDLRGQVIIINFWASWCLPCREEAAYLEETWRKYKDQGVVFIGVDYIDTESEALAYLQEFEVTYFNGPDLGTRISQLYNIQGVPETYFVSKKGELREPYIGPLSPPFLENIIEEMLAESYP